MFKITGKKGFHIRFGDITISVQFGYGNYCEGYPNYPTLRTEHIPHDSPDAEVALWDKDGEWVTREAWLECFGSDHGDDVAGWCSPQQVLALMNWANQKGGNGNDSLHRT